MLKSSLSFSSNAKTAWAKNNAEKINTKHFKNILQLSIKFVTIMVSSIKLIDTNQLISLTGL